MSYLNFNSTDNSIYAGKGDSKNFKKIIISKYSKNYTEYCLEQENARYAEEFNGIMIKDYLSDSELEGLKGEEKFKNLLETNNIPCLYIGQGPFGIEKSGVLINNVQAKRADFLVNFKDLGTLLFDVKCRFKKQLHNTNEKFFSLYISEINALYNLQKSLLIPVWIAFLEKYSNNHNFYFIPISTIIEYWKGIQNYINQQNEIDQIKILRIPNSLLTEVKDKIIFETGHKNIDESLLKEYAENYIGFNRVLKDKIKEIIRKKNCYKSYIFEELKEENIRYCYYPEVTNCVENLIQEQVIIYNKQQHLKLFGE